MGFLDKIVSMASDSILGEPKNEGLLDQAIKLINSPSMGGLPGLIGKFEKGGWQYIVSSWVGTGANKPVSGTTLMETGTVDFSISSRF